MKRVRWSNLDRRKALARWVVFLCLASPRIASACGGAFVPPAVTSTAFVTGQRMALAVSPTRTVLWSQLKYDGSPSEFAWVLPVRGAVKLEASSSAWFDSLDAVTNTRIAAKWDCPPVGPSEGCSGCISLGGGDDSAAPGTSSASTPSVTVNQQGSVGPYAYVELSSASSQSLIDWLTTNGFIVPADVEPVIAAYVAGGFDFIALKLRPGLGTHQMTPVRVITEGASPLVPLHMMVAGTGATVPITLYVIAEGRYEPQGFGRASIAFGALTWDWQSHQSNYETLRQQALAVGDGSNWLTSFASRGAFTTSFTDALGNPVTFRVGSSGVSGIADFLELYTTLGGESCPALFGNLMKPQLVADTCHPRTSGDGGVSSADAGGIEAGNDSDGGLFPRDDRVCDPAPSGETAATDYECGGLTDLAAAMIGMHPSDVWVTRLEANLPRAALANDLSLQAEATQTVVKSDHRATVYLNATCDHSTEPTAGSHPASRERPRVDRAGFGLLSGLVLLLIRRLGRRPVGV